MSEPLTATTPSNPSGLESALRRSELYLFLARAFLYPREDLTPTWQQAVAAAPYLKTELGEAFLSLEPPPLEALQREFVATFTHTSPRDYPVYEIEHVANQPFRDSRHLSLVAGFYRAFGLKPVPGERVDHIGVELEFMYYLTYKEAYAAQHLEMEKAATCRYAQKRFLEEHLGRWAPPFFQQLREQAQGYYSRLGATALDFLHGEYQHLGIQPKETGEEHLIASGEKELPSWGCGDED